MARLIDADKLKADFLGNRYGTQAIEYVIDHAPTIEAVPLEDYRSMEQTVYKLTQALAKAEPIVRCKDCKWYLASNEKCGLIDTRLQFYTTDKRWTENSYCCWGERKDEVEE